MRFYDQSKGYVAKIYGLRKDECMVDFYDRKTCLLPIGLIPRVTRILKSRYDDIKVLMTPGLKEMFIPPKGEVTMDTIKGYAAGLNIHDRESGDKLTPYEHQYRLAYRALNGRRISLLACTSAGKSLSMMIMARYLMEREHRKVLIIVPSTNLVEQLFSDFYNDYGWESAGNYCSLLHSTSTDKVTKKQKEKLEDLGLGEESVLRDITISTWQSLQNKPESFFKVFTAVIVDEAHSTRGEKLRAILAMCENANDFKVGVSGTLPSEGLDAGYIEGAIGRKEEIVRLKELVEKHVLTPVEVEAIYIPYPVALRTKICSMQYESEYAIATNNSSRKDVMDMLIKSGKITTDQNTVVLFKSIQNLELFLKHMVENHPEFKYHVIKGDIATDDRETIRKSIERGLGNIIVATYGCMKQGVNIKLLHNLVMAEPAKSPYMVVQSIGRIVRPHKDKKLARVFDFVDDASYMTNARGIYTSHLRFNGLLRHYKEFRQKYYEEDNIPVNEIRLDGLYMADVSIDDLQQKRSKAAAGNKKRPTGNPYKKKFFV